MYNDSTAIFKMNEHKSSTRDLDTLQNTINLDDSLDSLNILFPIV